MCTLQYFVGGCITVKKKITLLVFLILGLILLGGCASTGEVTKITGKVTEPTCKDVEVPYEIQAEYMKTEYYTERVPYTDKECESKDLIYSITDFKKDYEICNQKGDVCHDRIIGICSNREYYCMDKTISCSLNLNNLDNEVGVWSVNFNFYEIGNNNNVAGVKTNSNSLYPQTSQNFSQSVRITSEGIAGNANKEYTCTYDVASIPTKQVCIDVIKYQDIQRERQVTAYRPVTKY